jgi:hypothetical protein
LAAAGSTRIRELAFIGASGATESERMHAWIFRHRLRLLQIYGRVPPPPLPGARFAPVAPRAEPVAGSGGAVERTRKHVIVRPMPRTARAPR